MKRMLFHEISKGTFAEQMQALFEEAQLKATKYGAPVKIIGTIIVAPPDDEDNYGQIQHSVKMKLPEMKSRVFHTEYENGLIVNDGTDVNELLQIPMDFADERNNNNDKFARVNNGQR